MLAIYHQSLCCDFLSLSHHYFVPIATVLQAKRWCTPTKSGTVFVLLVGLRERVDGIWKRPWYIWILSLFSGEYFVTLFTLKSLYTVRWTKSGEGRVTERWKWVPWSLDESFQLALLFVLIFFLSALSTVPACVHFVQLMRKVFFSWHLSTCRWVETHLSSGTSDEQFVPY